MVTVYLVYVVNTIYLFTFRFALALKLITSEYSLLLISPLSFLNQLVRFASAGKFVTVVLKKKKIFVQ